MSTQFTPGRDEHGMPRLVRGAMWVAIGALIAAAIICVVWVLFTPEGDVIPKAFLTILVLAAFAGVVLLDAHLASTRPGWLVPVSMAAWVLTLLCALTLIWTPTGYWFDAPIKVWFFVLTVVFIQLTVLHQRLIWRAHERYVTTFTRVLVIVTSVIVVALLIMALVPLTLVEVFEYPDLYGRIMVALAILGAVGTVLVPIITAMFAPKRPRAAAPPLLPWPTYADGRTPLPALRNGQPDFDARRTGVPSPGSRSFGPAPVTPSPAPTPASPGGAPENLPPRPPVIPPRPAPPTPPAS